LFHVKRRLLTTAGLGVVAVLTFAVAGCGEKANTSTGGGTTGGGAPPPAAQDAPGTLAKAAATVSRTSFKVTGKIGADGTMNGVMDPQKKLGEFTMNISAAGQKMTAQMRLVGGETYMKITIPGSPLPGFDGKKWLHISAGKAGPASLSTFDASKIAATLEHATKVERVNDTTYKGTIDATKSAEALGQKKEALAVLGDKAKAIPFEATVDGQGRLSRFKLDMPAVGGEPAQTLDFTYSDFGTPVDVKAPPASEVAEGPGR
jgi:hypothetical protein